MRSSQLSPYFQLIHLTWSPGIKSKQTLADDERSVSVVLSLKLYGSPWSQAVYNSGKATIQARLIILELTRMLAAHKWRFAINVNFNGATDSFFYQWAPALEHNEEHCAVILSRYDRMRLLQVLQSLYFDLKCSLFLVFYKKSFFACDSLVRGCCESIAIANHQPSIFSFLFVIG